MQMSVGRQGLLRAEKRVTVCVLFRFRLDLDWQVDEVGCSPPPSPNESVVRKQQETGN